MTDEESMYKTIRIKGAQNGYIVEDPDDKEVYVFEVREEETGEDALKRASDWVRGLYDIDREVKGAPK